MRMWQLAHALSTQFCTDARSPAHRLMKRSPESPRGRRPKQRYHALAKMPKGSWHDYARGGPPARTLDLKRRGYEASRAA